MIQVRYITMDVLDVVLRSAVEKSIVSEDQYKQLSEMATEYVNTVSRKSVEEKRASNLRQLCITEANMLRRESIEAIRDQRLLAGSIYKTDIRLLDNRRLLESLNFSRLQSAHRLKVERRIEATEKRLATIDKDSPEYRNVLDNIQEDKEQLRNLDIQRLDYEKHLYERYSRDIEAYKEKLEATMANFDRLRTNAIETNNIVRQMILSATDDKLPEIYAELIDKRKEGGRS